MEKQLSATPLLSPRRRPMKQSTHSTHFDGIGRMVKITGKPKRGAEAGPGYLFLYVVLCFLVFSRFNIVFVFLLLSFLLVVLVVSNVFFVFPKRFSVRGLLNCEHEPRGDIPEISRFSGRAARQRDYLFLRGSPRFLGGPLNLP